ncbi:MAG: hypothetical protein IJI11_06365, partial [Mogibacterium sp.]|nr:hypothetical protein [Mogibacterium sp.]MBQ6315201.1 hypothetical protein [Mogibacterium sp.]
MDYNGLYFASRDKLCEDAYNLATEANRATLLTTGNGYMGVRASLEEYGSLGVQGCYIRGVLDEVVEGRLVLMAGGEKTVLDAGQCIEFST